MSTGMELDPDRAALADPATSAEHLQAIASRRPDLYQAVLEHPNAYPELSQWIQSKQVSLPRSPVIAQPSPEQMTTSSPEVATSKKRKTLLILGIVGAVLLLALGGFLVWWFAIRDDSDAAASQAYGTLPEIGTVVDVSTFGRDVSIIPVGPEQRASYAIDGIQLVALEGESGYAVAAIDLEADQVLPQWIVPIAATPSQCVLKRDVLSCASQSYRVTAAAPVPIEASEDTGSRLQPARPQSVVVGVAADGALAYGLSGRSLIDDSGETVVELPDSSAIYYGIAPSQKGLPTLISDGRTVVAVKGTKVVWSKTLSVGASAVNGFEEGQEPSWQEEGEVLLIAQPDGVLAIDVRSGEELWRIDTPVVSWRADQGTLVISQGTSVVALPFTDKDQAGPGEPAKSGDDETGGKQLVVGAAQHVPEPPSVEELMDSYIAIPASCRDESGMSGPRVVFEGGVASSDKAMVLMTGASTIVMAGELATVVSFDCWATGGDPVPAVAAYDTEMEMLGELPFSDDLAVMPWMLLIDGLRGEGSAVQIVVSTASGKLCPDCSSEAQVEMIWDGTSFVTTRVGDPPPNWWNLGNTVAIVGNTVESWGQFGDEGTSEVPGLSAADLANIELYLPMAPGAPDSPYVTRSFNNYVAEEWDNGAVETEIVSDQIYSAEIGGEPFLFAPIWTASDGYGGSLIGSVCAISADAVVSCAPIPEGLATSFIAASDLTVNGNEVTYALYGDSEIPLSWVTQSFDGERFTLISDVR